MLSNRQNTILQTLRTGAASAFTLAVALNAPTASVRRDIQALRKAGHRIDDARDFNGLYRLVSA